MHCCRAPLRGLTRCATKAGEDVNYDYTLTDLDGNEVSLADYKGKWLVIESGSLTCPMCSATRGGWSRCSAV